MNRILVAGVFLTVAAIAFGETKTDQSATSVDKKAKEEAFLKKTGGLIVLEGSGKILVINAQSTFPESAITSAIKEFNDVLRMPSEVRSGTWKFCDKIPDDASVAVYVVDDAKLPMSLVATEARWGVVNAAGLDERQFAKEFYRVMVATLGAGVSQYKVSPMQPVHTPLDLDSIVKCALTMDNVMSMRANLGKLGVTPSHTTAYRKACMEGWAPAPTNDYQKAIWNQVKADKERGPTNPIEIPMPTKK